MTDPADLALDLHEVPFSSSGSWFGLSPVVGLHTVSDAVHLVSHVNGLHAVLRLEPCRDGAAVEASWHATSSVLEWRTGSGTVSAAFDGPDRLRLRGSGVGLRLTEVTGELTPFTGGFLFRDPADGAVVLTSYETGRRYRVRSLTGSLDADGVEALGAAPRGVDLGADGADWEAEVVETTSTPPPSDPRGFDDVVADQRAAFTAFVEAVAPWRDATTPAAARAAYTIWSATVRPEGLVTRPAVLMSKHWMDKVWSWDHCFNALALAPGLPDLALDQLLLPFDHQDAAGALPDSVTHSEALFNYVKPPVHGWALAELRAVLPRPLTPRELTEVHDRLAAWSGYWLEHRREPGHDLPHYHHGNDSGWDNATAFDAGRVARSPDLAAFLAVQLDVLADLADELGRPAADWRAESDRLVTALLDRLWTPEGFVAEAVTSGRRSGTTTLLTVLPLLLGRRLPEEVRTTLVARLGPHLTEHGPATERPDSPHYEDDGYWRGPIWAPSTHLVVAGLRRCGHDDLADDVARRFLRLCERSGFAENFDALTGAGLRDRAYTWTAAVYLVLAREQVVRGAA